MSKLILIIALFLTSCYSYNMKEAPAISGVDQYKKYVLFCVSNVEYFKTSEGISPHFKPDGTLYGCKEE